MADTAETPVQKYLTLIGAYDAEFKKWEARNTKLLKRYRDDNRSASRNDTARFNILWSNVQTLIPAVYAKLPQADVLRRFGDNDQVGRVAALLIERSLDFEIEHYPDFRQTMRYAVEDRFLGGRGVAWVRYEPHVRAQSEGLPEDGLEVTDDTDDVDPAAASDTQDLPEQPEEIEYECAPVDYVHWKDFGHNVARMWDEVTVVWRWVYMTKEALDERFGKEKAAKIPLDSGPEPLNGKSAKDSNNTRAKIAEIWDKETGKAYWLSKTFPDFVDERDDPLQLEGFFPCPRPLYATLTSDSLVPVPDFVLYQDQASELDILSDRIDGLVKALRVRGVYDASQPALQRLLTEGENNLLVPVDNWQAFTEKNGLQGSIDLVPLDMLSKALLDCYQAREDIKGQIYEITGISDILRGQTAASETATAQQIKGQYAGLRLRSMQEDVALFATELLRLKAQIICSKFQPETILQYSAAQQLTAEDQQMVPQALQLIKDKVLRNFRIEVAADSLVQIDEDQNKKDRLEFIAAFGGFMRDALPAAQQDPKIVPMLAEVLKFGVGAFKQARQIEGTLDASIEKMKQAQKQAEANPQPPPPSPDEMKIKAQQQSDQAKLQAQQQTDGQKMQLEQARIQADAQVKQQQMTVDQQIAREKIAADIEIARLQINATADAEAQRLAMQLEHEAGMATAQRQFDGDQQSQQRMAESQNQDSQRQFDAQNQDKQLAASQQTEAAKLQAGQQTEAAKLAAQPKPEGEGNDQIAMLKELVAKIEHANRPRKVVRDAQGLIQGIE